MNVKKLLQAVAHLINKYDGRLNYTKLIKLLYLADKQSIAQRGRPITEDAYYSMKEGPVLSRLLSLIKGEALPRHGRNDWNLIFRKDGFDLRLLPGASVDDDELSDSELEILDAVDAKYHSWSWKRVVNEVMHNPKITPEWEKRTSGCSPLPIARVFKAVDLDESAADLYHQDRKHFEQVNAWLSRGSI